MEHDRGNLAWGQHRTALSGKSMSDEKEEEVEDFVMFCILIKEGQGAISGLRSLLIGD